MTKHGLPHPDKLHLEAAVGWLELGNWREANEELERITPRRKAYPDVLQVRCKVYIAAAKWEFAASPGARAPAASPASRSA